MGKSGEKWQKVEKCMVFRGRFARSVDPKGRLLLPNEFREGMAKAPANDASSASSFVLTTYDGCLVAFSLEDWEELEQKFVDMLTEQFDAAGYTAVEKGDGYITPEYVPVTDGITYINPSAGDTTAYNAVANGFYQLYLLNGTTIQPMLTKDPLLAEEILKLETVKLIFDASNVIVGIAS